MTGVSQYLEYKTTIVAPEPFIERVLGAIRSMGGRICTHMLLQVPSQDHCTIGVMTCDRS
jgi:hypothetical protein